MAFYLSIPAGIDPIPINIINSTYFEKIILSDFTCLPVPFFL
jgi:hypothetical protein